MSVASALDETRDLLIAGLETWDIVISEEQLQQFLTYRDLLIDWNTNRLNLTRLISPRDIAIEHFLDSLSLIKAIDIPHRATLLDIGAGAGFPSLPLKILRPDLQVTLLEATAKKLNFCQVVAEELGLTNITFIHDRAEGLDQHLIRRFRIVTARAVANLTKLLPLCEPYRRGQDGVIAALKSAKADDEIADAHSTLNHLRLQAKSVTVTIPGSDRSHQIVVCRRK